RSRRTASLASPRGRHRSRSFSHLRTSNRSWLPLVWEQRQRSILTRKETLPLSEHRKKGVSCMSAEENKVIARRFIQVWGQGSLDTLDELAASNFSVYYPVLNEPIYGPEAFKQHLMRARSAVPDATIESLDEIAEGDKVVVRWTVHGTHQGVFLGIPPTGQQLTWTGMTIYRIADGKVVEERGEEDALGLMQQLGVVPPAG